MVFVSLTRLRVRSAWFLPPFALLTLRSWRQVRAAAGFEGGSLLADRRRTFWTMTAWDGEASMRAYMTAGAHRAAMPRLLDWCDEASVAHWVQAETTLPSWPEADDRMRRDGRPSRVRNPSPDHAGLTFARAGASAGAPIRPARRR